MCLFSLLEYIHVISQSLLIKPLAHKSPSHFLPAHSRPAAIEQVSLSQISIPPTQPNHQDTSESSSSESEINSSDESEAPLAAVSSVHTPFVNTKTVGGRRPAQEQSATKVAPASVSTPGNASSGKPKTRAAARRKQGQNNLPVAGNIRDLINGAADKTVPTAVASATATPATGKRPPAKRAAPATKPTTNKKVKA